MAEWYRELSGKKGLGAEEPSRYNQLISHSRFMTIAVVLVQTTHT